jgi:hypothetical protein
MKKVYLIGFIDKASGMLSHAWYYGENAVSLTHDAKRWHAFNITSETQHPHDSYEDAVERLYFEVESDPRLKWLVPYIRHENAC